MTLTDRSAAPRRTPMDPQRRTSLVAGVFYLVTFISIPTLFIYGPVRSVGYVLGAGPDTGALGGGVLELIVALAGIGTAITLFPVVRRQNEGFAIGFVTARVLEASMIFVGVVALLSVVALRRDPAGADPAALVAVGKGLTTVYGWTFLFGQTLMPAINGVLLGTLMYRSGLVPRIIPTMGLIGAPLLLGSVTAIVFGLWEITSVWHALATLPIFLWELSLGVWLTVKGFKPSAPVLHTATV
jgi:Domain of unknown function (DUF4386)